MKIRFYLFWHNFWIRFNMEPHGQPGRTEDPSYRGEPRTITVQGEHPVPEEQFTQAQVCGPLGTGIETLKNLRTKKLCNFSTTILMKQEVNKQVICEN